MGTEQIERFCKTCGTRVQHRMDPPYATNCARCRRRRESWRATLRQNIYTPRQTIAVSRPQGSSHRTFIGIGIAVALILMLGVFSASNSSPSPLSSGGGGGGGAAYTGGGYYGAPMAGQQPYDPFHPAGYPTRVSSPNMPGYPQTPRSYSPYPNNRGINSPESSIWDQNPSANRGGYNPGAPNVPQPGRH